jgi:MFS family permease
MSGELANYLIATLFTLHIVLYTLISVSVNVFVEEFSDHENIGSIRGTMLTIYNFGAVASPFIAAQIFSLVGFSGLFILSALSLLPLIYITKKFFSHVKEPKYKHINLFSSFRIVLKDKNIRGVIVSSFILNAFYAAVNVYLALYLLETIGIPASLYLGLIVPITVIPFILIPYQLGKYSDEIFGEKKAMIAGIFILSVALIIIPGFNITTNNIFVWIILLFIARVGATITETENYAYFYKKIDGRSAGLIALFQNMVNVSFVFVTLLGAILLNLFNIDLPVIFLIVGLLGLLSIFIIIKIRDTEIKRRKTIAKANIHIKKEEEVKEVLAEAEWEISKAKRN